MKKILLYLFPIVYPIINIYSFFIEKEYNKFFTAELVKRGIQEAVPPNVGEIYLIVSTGFEKYRLLYIFTLFCQSLIFMLLPFGVHLFNKKRQIVSNVKCALLTILCFIIAFVLSGLLGGVVVDYLCNGRFYNVLRPEYNILFPFTVIFNSLSLLDAISGEYKIWGIIGFVFEYYIFYVIWLILKFNRAEKEKREKTSRALKHSYWLLGFLIWGIIFFIKPFIAVYLLLLPSFLGIIAAGRVFIGHSIKPTDEFREMKSVGGRIYSAILGIVFIISFFVLSWDFLSSKKSFLNSILNGVFSKSNNIKRSSSTKIKNNLPFGLKWKMKKEQVEERLKNAGFENYNINYYDHGEFTTSNNDFEKLCFINSNEIKIYVLMYKEGLYQIVFRLSEVSEDEQKKGLKKCYELFGDTELEFEQNGGNYYYWKTEKSLIHYLYVSNNTEPLLSITRLSVTDLETKKNLGLGAP